MSRPTQTVSGDRYLTFVIGGVIELAAYILAFAVLQGFSRKIPLVVYLIPRTIMSNGFTRQQTEEKAQSGSKGYIVIQLALSIAMLALGVQLQDHCSADERIPIYMIGCGATDFAWLGVILLFTCCGFCTEGKSIHCIPIFWILFLITKVALLLFGSVVVLGVGELNYDDNTAETYCLYSPYMFAYVIIIFTWIGLALAGIWFCCFLALK